MGAGPAEPGGRGGALSSGHFQNCLQLLFGCHEFNMNQHHLKRARGIAAAGDLSALPSEQPCRGGGRPAFSFSKPVAKRSHLSILLHEKSTRRRRVQTNVLFQAARVQKAAGRRGGRRWGRDARPRKPGARSPHCRGALRSARDPGGGTQTQAARWPPPARDRLRKPVLAGTGRTHGTASCRQPGACEGGVCGTQGPGLARPGGLAPPPPSPSGSVRSRGAGTPAPTSLFAEGFSFL